LLRELDTSVGVSGPHDFAVRLSAIRQKHIRVHCIPPRVRDDRDTPLEWDETAIVLKVIWVNRKPEYFRKGDWTTQITLIRFNKLDF
jgi:hypothetical protein